MKRPLDWTTARSITRERGVGKPGRGGLKALAAMLALALVLAACGSDDPEPDDDPAEPVEETQEEPDEPDDGEEPADEPDDAAAEPDGDLPVVKIQGLDSGMAALGTVVLDEEGFDVANGFQGEYFFIPPAAATQSFLRRETDVSFDSGPPEVALGVGAGLDVVAISGHTRNHVHILVGPDSSASSIEDLVGQDVGHFSPDSTADLTLTMILDAFHDLNWNEDFNLFLSPPPALVELLAAGEVEGAISFQPHMSRGISGDNLQIAFDPEVTWREETGGSLWTTTVAVHRDWVGEDPERAENVLKAWCDGADFINNNPDVIISNQRYVDFLNLDEAGLQVFHDYIVERRESGFPLFNCGWTDDEVENLNLYFDLLAERSIAITSNPGNVVQRLEDVIAEFENA